MGALSEMTFGEVLAALGRYRPVVVAVVVILAVLRFLPNHHVAAVASTTSGAVATTATTRPSGAVADAPSADATVDGSTADVGSALGATSSPVTPFSSGTFVTSPPPSSSSSSSAVTSPGASSPTAGADFGGDSSGSSDEVIPLRIAASAWATNAGAGTPVGSAQVTAGTLPVGTRLGGDDKRSFVRLMGSGATLTLTEDAAGGRAPVNGTASVSACQVTVAGWPEAEGESFDAAPKFDAGQCVVGARSAEGVWVFSLGSFPSPSDGRGFALVPTPGSSVDFQVAFKR